MTTRKPLARKAAPDRQATPASLGYRMPAEWERHAATWIAWPHNRSDWPGKFAAIPWVYAEIVRHLSYSERVHILVNDQAARDRALEVLDRQNARLENVFFFAWPTNRVWTRDYGPIFVTRPKGRDRLALTNWRFNAWAKYDDWQHDNAIPPRIVRAFGFREFRPIVRANGRPLEVVLEGGSIDVNGRGMLITTEECLLSPDVQARNPALSREQLEQVFADYLGISKVLWLGKGIAGDDTHGHIDDITRFVDEGTVVTVVEYNRNDPNYAPLKHNLNRLRAASDQAGHRLDVVELPMPAPVYFRGQRLPASYANFYIANERVLVPTFNDPNDRVALAVLADLFPSRTVVGIHSVDLIWGLGTLHCLTQQQPAQ